MSKSYIDELRTKNQERVTVARQYITDELRGSEPMAQRSSPKSRRLMMNTVVLELPFDALALPGVTSDALAREAQFMLALKLFEIGRLSSGKAARLCGMGRVEFLLAAGRAEVPVATLDEDELKAEFDPNV